jgi:hypothetical protein
MKRLSLATIICTLLLAVYANANSQRGTVVTVTDSIDEAYRNKSRDVQVRSSGVVTRVLSDDNEGSRHQRFIVRLESGLTVLIAHNIDLAPRVAGLKKGDRVEFSGEYVWNNKGGTVHWTHHDPRGRHPEGWIKHKYRTYR